MTDSLTERQRQILALAILVLAMTIVVMLTIAPLWVLNRHYLDTIDGLEGRVAVLERSAAAGNGLRSQHQQLQHSPGSDRHYLKSTTEALAAADLQGIIKRIAGPHGMEVLSTQIMPVTEESGFTRVALKVRMRGMLDGMIRVFYALETGQPYLFLENVSIRSRIHRRSNRDASQVLDVDFNLIGYMPRKS